MLAKALYHKSFDTVGANVTTNPLTFITIKSLVALLATFLIDTLDSLLGEHIISAVALIRGLMLKKHGGPRLCLKSVLKNSTMFTRLSSVV